VAERGGKPAPRELLEEITRQAESELARGVRFWSDPALIDELRALVKEVASGGAVTSSSAAAPARASTPAKPKARAAARAPSSAAPPVSSSAASETRRTTWPPPPDAVGRAVDWAEQLAAVRAEAMGCTKCGLCEGRANVVFGSGTGRIPLVFVGEAPGADEDRQGLPFVGRSGQLLTKIIEAIGLSRDDCYICNVIKCRPPDNRNPAPDEISKCSPFLERQIDILRPKVICTLGLFATQRLLDSTAPIGQLRGRFHDYRGVPVLPTYHPAALLRNPSLKPTVWEDVQLLRRKLDE